MSITKGTPASSQIIWLEDRVKEQEEEIERLRKDKEILIAAFRVNMLRCNPEYSREEFDNFIEEMLSDD